MERAADSAEQRLRLAAWDDLGRLIAWFRDALSAADGAGRDAELAFSHILSKEHRAQVICNVNLACWPEHNFHCTCHTAYTRHTACLCQVMALRSACHRQQSDVGVRRQVHAAVGDHGSVVTVSRGVGDERYVSVVHRASDAARQQVSRPAHA